MSQLNPCQLKSVYKCPLFPVMSPLRLTINLKVKMMKMMTILGMDLEILVNVLITVCTLQYVAEHIYNIRELENTEKEILVMASLSHGGFGKKLPNPRKIVKNLCRGALLFVYYVKEHTLDSLQTLLHKHGVTPRSMQQREIGT